VNRDDVFVDVAQDVCVLLARAGAAHRTAFQVAYGHFSDEAHFKPITSFSLPKTPGDPWSPPHTPAGLARGGATLLDYGVTLRSGYFVWNREQQRMKTRRDDEMDVPLIWARNIVSGKLCRPHARKRHGVDYVAFEQESEAIVREPAIVLQRTTNSAQPRRLIAARVSDEVYQRWGGFVSENHTIVATSDGSRKLTLVCRLLNSKSVDARYRQLSGTASVSVTLLRTLDLPDPDILERETAKTYDFEQAVAIAYQKSNKMMVAA
jgi:adenine-specific DNA-methyltransferase